MFRLKLHSTISSSVNQPLVSYHTETFFDPSADDTWLYCTTSWVHLPNGLSLWLTRQCEILYGTIFERSRALYPRTLANITWRYFCLQCGSTYHVEMVIIRVTDGQVAAVQVHLPRHLLWTVLLHLQIAQTANLVIVWRLIFQRQQKWRSTSESSEYSSSSSLKKFRLYFWARVLKN